MRRFFSTSNAVLRIPPGAPSRVKQIPVPRSAVTTDVIKKYVDLQPTPEHTPPRSSYVSQMLPDISANPQLTENKDVWYYIARSRSGNLPVYTDYNNAGGVWTEIRKISGNVSALRNDLKIALGLSKSDIWVKNAANVVVIKGNWSQQVKKVLQEQF